jgi:hypothetical protein
LPARISFEQQVLSSVSLEEIVTFLRSTLMNKLLFLLVVFGAVPCFSEPAKFNSTDWSRELETVRYQGRDATILAGGSYALKEVDLKDGRVEVDISMHGQRGFVGLVFRYQSEKDFELVYLRPHKSRLPDAVQYAPSFNGMTTWQLYSEGYMAAAELPHNRWMHIAIEFVGTSASVYLDDREEPALVINDLKHGESRGSIGLWGRNVAHFSNLEYGPPTGGAPIAITPEPIEPGIISDWDISEVYESAVQTEAIIPSNISWRAVDVEPPGLVNVSRTHAKISTEARTDQSAGKDLIYARTTVVSATNELRKLHFGYSDGITIFLNGEPIYQGFSAYNARYPFSLGILGTDNDSVFLPLREGENELIFAISEVFGGWGFMAKWD